MIPAWIMDWSFWLAIAAMVVLPVVFSYGLHRFIFSHDPKDNSEEAAVPEEIYRIVELREFVDALWFKIYGHAIDDFRLVRIDRALGRATVGEYRIRVMREIGTPALGDRDMFLTLARAAAIDAEISRSGSLNPADLIELEKAALGR